MKARTVPFIFAIFFASHVFAQTVTATDPNKGTVTKNPSDRPVCVEQDAWFDCKIDRINVYPDRITLRCAGGNGFQQSVGIGKTNLALAEQFLSIASSAYLSGSTFAVFRKALCGESTGVPGCASDTCSRADAFSIVRR